VTAGPLSVVVKGEGSFRLRGDAPEAERANAFLESIELRGLSPRTVRAYAMDLLVLLRWSRRADVEWAALTERHLLAFLEVQRAQEAKPRSINRRLSTAKLFYRFITGSDVPRAPGVPTPGRHFRGRGRERNLGLHSLRPQRRMPLRVKVPRTLIEPLTEKCARSFLERLAHRRDVALVYLMLLCGLRSREVLTLTVSDVSFSDRRLRVHGKGGKERALPIPAVLQAVLTEYLQLERPERTSSDRLFLILKGPNRGLPMTSEGLRSLFRHRRKQAELANANAHRFRHTFGTDMARAGVRLPVLQRMMGHAHAETTLQYVNLSMADVAAEFRRAMTTIQRRYRGSHR